MHKITSAVATLSAAVLTFGLGAPAQAVGIGISDPADTGHGSDLRAVQINNRDHKLVVVTSHTNLRPDPRNGSSGVVYVDTDRTDRGPEFVFVAGYFEGTDYQLLHTEGFGRSTWGAPADGFAEMSVNYDKDRVRMTMSDEALDDPGKVRVSVRVSGTRRDGSSDGLRDWLGEPRSFTPWVAKG